MILPHAPVYLSDIRVNDIWFLLGVGALYELVTRAIVIYYKKKPAFIQQKEIDLKLLQVETDYKRGLGIQSFVETSKLERQVLQYEQELAKLYKYRKAQVDSIEKTLIKYGNYQIAGLLWCFYYAVPLLVVSDVDTDNIATTSSNLLKTMLFPISYIGVGIRISRFGLPADIAANSIGALFVLWSSQVTVGKLMDIVEAYFVQ